MWTRLSDMADAGSTTLQLTDRVDWVVGDEVVVSSTDFDYQHAETRTVTAVGADGLSLTLDQPLNFMHWGCVHFWPRFRRPSRVLVVLFPSAGHPALIVLTFGPRLACSPTTSRLLALAQHRSDPLPPLPLPLPLPSPICGTGMGMPHLCQHVV